MQASVETKSDTAKGAAAETRTELSEALARDLAALMKHLFVPTGREFFAELEKAGISLTQAKSLMFLSDAERPMSVKALSDALGLSLPGISRSIEAMVQRGDVKREEDPNDRRSKLVTITPRGRRLWERLLAVRLAGVRRFVEELTTEEQEALAHGVGAVAGRFDR
jgi:DNA-binding MarR family transcriptional regulator